MRGTYSCGTHDEAILAALLILYDKMYTFRSIILVMLFNLNRLLFAKRPGKPLDQEGER